MKTLGLFYVAADEAFEKLKTGGSLVGIKMRPEGIVFVWRHPVAMERLVETIWPEAAVAWEEIFRGIAEPEPAAADEPQKGGGCTD